MTDNPFKRDEKGNIKSLKAIMDVSRETPEYAKMLCRDAGEDPGKWFPQNPK